MLDFDRDWCNNFSYSGANEWLVTNGLGGYASGTVAGQISRRYHGLLIVPTKPPLGRKLLLSNLEETVKYRGKSFQLYTRHMKTGDIHPKGFKNLKRFHLEGTIPVWTYAHANLILEKRIWMEHGSNTTYIQYFLRGATETLILSIRALLNHRDHHAETKVSDWNPQINQIKNGIEIIPGFNFPAYYIFCDNASLKFSQEWITGFHLSTEAYRGLPDGEDLISVGEFMTQLTQDESITIVATTEKTASTDGDTALTRRQLYEQQILDQAGNGTEEDWVNHLNLTADQFIVQRQGEENQTGHSIIAGYPWFGDWGRDTMISLPGLTLTTGKEVQARSILLTYAQFTDRGMLPNNFPDTGDEPMYNTVDATLWYFEALRAYFLQTGDKELLSRLFPTLDSIIEWHIKGTRHNIMVDPEDGLLYSGEKDVQLTWMDAKVDDWVVTPRIGKAVEVSALWYNALLSMVAFAEQIGKSPRSYLAAAKKTKKGFSKFWIDDFEYCYDVVDGPQGNDASLRPNQIIAASIHHSPLKLSQQRSIVDYCTRFLLTPFGLRSLASKSKSGNPNPAYIGSYGGNRTERDAAYHQGTVWAWLMGPFLSAHLRAYNDPQRTKSFLLPMVRQLSNHGLGSISEIFDGDPPFEARGCISQAWSVGELLRVWSQINDQLG